MKLNQGLIVLNFIFLLSFYSGAFAEEQDQSYVEVQVPQDIYSSYSERRGDNGFLVGLDYEALILKNFYSSEDHADYNSLFGSETIPMVHFSIDYKRNITLGSLALGIDVGAGSITGETNRSLDVKKIGGGLKFIADNFMEEPYVAPYLGCNFWTLETVDHAAISTITETTGMGINYTVGALVQLNWIDRETSHFAALNYGLENTYINLYATQYLNTGNSKDVDTETDLLWGAGIKLEF